MNIERMRAVAADVLRHDKQFNMRHWFISRWAIIGRVGKIPAEGLDECGTACCIAEAAALRARTEGFPMDPYEEIGIVASRYLGLTEDQVGRLFNRPNWDLDLNTRYVRSCDAIGRAQAAVEQIERMIAEEEAANAKEI